MAKKQMKPSEDEFATVAVANEKVKEIIGGLMLRLDTVKKVKIEVRRHGSKTVSRLTTIPGFTQELRDL